jgi:hypothetical protein
MTISLSFIIGAMPEPLIWKIDIWFAKRPAIKKNQTVRTITKLLDNECLWGGLLIGTLISPKMPDVKSIEITA